MALAVTHVLIPIIILDLLRHYLFGKKKFSRYLLVIGGIAGLAPDIDIPLSWLINLFADNNVNLHSLSISHSFLFVLVFLSIALLFQSRHNQKWANIFYVIAAGWTMHLGLDWFFGEYKQLFWPFMTPAYMFPSWDLWKYSESIDAIILVLWLVHEEFHKYIKDYF